MDSDQTKADLRASTDVSALHAERYILAFNAERNARYHASRRSFFELLHRWTLFSIVVLGTAGVFNGVVALGLPPATTGGLAAILGALSLVFAPFSKAQLHETLHRRSFELASEIDLVVNPKAADIARWRSRLNLIYADEPPPMRALGAVAYNATLASRKEEPNDEMLILRVHHIVFKQICSFANAHFPRRREWLKQDTPTEA